MKILDLSLTYHWYDEIESGRKKEEYRQLKRFYYKRLLDFSSGVCIDNLINAQNFAHYDAVRFHRGQGGKTTMLFKIEDIRIGYGRPEWGAPDNEKVFIIQLGDKIQ